jgi:predicted TIM-barrel fold metal-dependent hydrolase
VGAPSAIDARKAAIAAELGWHVQYHSITRDDIELAADRLLALPCPVVLDHFGMFDPRLGLDQPAFATILRMLDSGRVWVKLSGPMRAAREEEMPYPSMTRFAHAPRRARARAAAVGQRLAARADEWSGDAERRRLARAARRVGADEGVRNRILAENPVELYR